jgi:hypothetical protein
MIWILATRGASTKLRTSPFTETVIEGVHSVVYKPGVEPVPLSGGDAAEGPLGTFERGTHRLSGLIFSYDGLAAETLLGIDDDVDLIIRYRASGERRKRTLTRIVFVGDAQVVVPAMNSGLAELVGVPFRMQIPEGETLSDHVLDTTDS